MSLDPEAVSAWMAEAVPDAEPIQKAEKIQGGQSNPTYILHAGDARYVLRRKPGGVLLKSAHAVEREYRVQAALAGTGVPVAQMLALCEDTKVIGSAFYVMGHVEGRAFDDPRLTDVPAERWSFFKAWPGFLQLSIKLTSMVQACLTMAPAAITIAVRLTAGPASTAPAKPRRSRPWTD
jgi:aminoglycoside phosphotransferase (APT) family kinase protein